MQLVIITRYTYRSPNKTLKRHVDFLGILNVYITISKHMNIQAEMLGDLAIMYIPRRILTRRWCSGQRRAQRWGWWGRRRRSESRGCWSEIPVTNTEQNKHVIRHMRQAPSRTKMWTDRDTCKAHWLAENCNTSSDTSNRRASGTAIYNTCSTKSEATYLVGELVDARLPAAHDLGAATLRTGVIILTVTAVWICNTKIHDDVTVNYPNNKTNFFHDFDKHFACTHRFMYQANVELLFPQSFYGLPSY